MSLRVAGKKALGINDPKQAKVLLVLISVNPVML